VSVVFEINMKKWVLVAVVLGCVSLLAQEGMRADGNSGAQEEVKKAELDLAQMIVKGEWDQYAAYLMDDYEHTSTVSESKAQWLERLRSGADKVLDLAPEELMVRVYGDTAILSGHFTLVQRKNGRVDTFFTRETEVFLRRNGRWMLAAEHATSMGK